MNIDTMSGLSLLNTFNNYGGTNYITGESKLSEDILLLLTQNKYQFGPDPDFGCTLQDYLFEAATEENANMIQLEIIEAIHKSYPNLILNQVNIDYFENGYVVTIVYSKSQDGTTSEIKINLLKD